MPFTQINNGDTGLSSRTTLNNIITELNTYGIRVQYSNDGATWSYAYTSGDDWIRFLTVDGAVITQGLQFGGGASWDEATFNTGNGDLNFIINSIVNETVNLDGRYALASAALQSVYTIILPAATTVAGRIGSPVSLPSGWVLSDDGTNLDIQHNLNRRVVAVSIFADANPTYDSQQLFNTAAYNGVINIDTNNAKIQSLATVNKQIFINLTFDNIT